MLASSCIGLACSGVSFTLANEYLPFVINQQSHTRDCRDPEANYRPGRGPAQDPGLSGAVKLGRIGSIAPAIPDVSLAVFDQ